MDPALLAALAEPNRLRIVELLGGAPRSVGEVAAQLGLRQPQATKHLQTLERAGLVTAHPLGQRRIYALRRAPLRELRASLARFDVDGPDEDVLARYHLAIEAERGASRTLAFARVLAASPATVWRAWTTEEEVGRWWAPRHFTVAECVVEPRPGGTFRVVLAEGDGRRHTAAGAFAEATRPRHLRFTLAPLDASGAPLFDAVHDVRLTRRAGGTNLALKIDVTGVRPEAAPAVAGLEPGWEQLLDHLAAAVEPRRQDA